MPRKRKFIKKPHIISSTRKKSGEVKIKNRSGLIFIVTKERAEEMVKKGEAEIIK